MEPASVLNNFHPVIKDWFTDSIGSPSMPQILGWPEIQAGSNVLISAPTGAGKTLAAFLESIDHLLKKSLEDSLSEGVFLLYVSPLKALNNDIYKNLDIPLKGIREYCEKSGVPFPEIKKAVRTGDTPQSERQKILKSPPQILITTPESLYLMLTSKKTPEILKNIRYLIVDEIHTMLGTKRGVHLALSIERLSRITLHDPVRIGLSATVNPVETAACYLGGFKKTGNTFKQRPVSIVAPFMERSKDLKIHMPVPDYRILELGTIWPEIYDSLLSLIKKHESTIVFVNNRAVAERVSANINSLIDEDISLPHHGSMSKSKRLDVEERFKNGKLKCIVATSTLELGIDIGSVDLMVQVESPLTVSGGLQRLGRAGHRLDATSKGRIIPKTRGDLLKSAFICKEMLDGNIEQEKIPLNCLDILSQHIVSMSCEGEWTEDGMFDVIKSAWSYKDLQESDFKKVLAMLAGDYEHMEDIPSKPRILWDRQGRTVKGTTYSRMLAVNSGGTIPDRGYFPVVLEDYKTRVGELDEVFVFEARIGERFMLGNSAWKIVRIEKNRVIVSPGTTTGAKTPFWQGDGIGCPHEQGIAFGRFLKNLEDKMDSGDPIRFLTSSASLDETAAINIYNYLSDQQDAVGCLSHNRRIVVEYLRDDVSDQKIIIHAHFGGRVNSVLAILIQKALEESIRCQVFSSHSNDAILIHLYGCPDTLTGILSLLNPSDVENALMSMLPTTSRFAMTFRYNAYRALMMGVRSLGQRLPLWLQRLRSVDALENARRYMDHPLLIETMRECLEEIYDIPNSIEAIKDIRSGKIEVVEKNTWFPSPFSSELLFGFRSQMMYAEKNPHPAEIKGPVISGLEALNLSYRQNGSIPQISADVILDVSRRHSALSTLKTITSAAGLHSQLLIYGDISYLELPEINNQCLIDELLNCGRILRIDLENSGLIFAAEEIELYEKALGLTLVNMSPEMNIAVKSTGTWTQEEAITRIIKRFSRYHSPFTLMDIQNRYRFNTDKINHIINRLKSDGHLIIGSYASGGRAEFFHSKVYESMIRKEADVKSRQVIARKPEIYASFIKFWQGIGEQITNPENALLKVIQQLEGLYLPPDWWETIVFPARIKGYSQIHLDRLCSSGRVFWRILREQNNGSLSLAWFCPENNEVSQDSEFYSENDLSDEEENVLNILRLRGASFTHALASLCKIQSSRLLDILEQLVYKGLVVNDSFISVRYFMNKSAALKRTGGDPVRHAKQIARAVSGMDMGRWEIPWIFKEIEPEKLIDRWFHRYGLLSREFLQLEHTSYTWNEIYEALKLREYAGTVLRGFFIQGISGVQFMHPKAYGMLDSSSGMQIINACDPAQVYGKIFPRDLVMLPFSNTPGTAVIESSGKPIAVFERYGDKITINGDPFEISEALKIFKQAFIEKRIWPEKKKISVKYFPDDLKEKELLQSALRATGFKDEVLKLVLWR